MRIAIAGGSGFIGKALTEKLLAEKHEVYILTRELRNSESVKYVRWLHPNDQPELELEHTDIFINLAGESLNNGRWTTERKKKILHSRLVATQEINRIISKMTHKPKALLNASAIGYYGTSLSQVFTEENHVQPSDYLSQIVHLWEKEASQSISLGVRTVFMRFGVVLGENTGALPRMVIPYRLFVGGTIGSGKQWLSWIHLQDVVDAIIHCSQNENIHGAVNFTAPHPETMKNFGLVLAKVLGKPHYFPTPAPLLQLLLGEMSVLVLEGQKVLPQQLIQHDFAFSYPTLNKALDDLLIK